MRSSPISVVTFNEIKRLARPSGRGGCRFTYASNLVTFNFGNIGLILRHLLQLGPAIQQGRIADPDNPNDPKEDTEFWVINIRKP